MYLLQTEISLVCFRGNLKNTEDQILQNASKMKDGYWHSPNWKMFFIMWISWTSLWKTLEIMFSLQILGFRRKLNFWKNNVVKENLEMFSLLLGPKAINKCQSCWKGPGRMKNKIDPYFPCLKHKCMTRRGSISLTLAGVRTQFWGKKEFRALQPDCIF